MSASNGPSVATSGLVFYYDMSNTKKSWLGKPTTNLYGSFGSSDALRSNTQFSWDGNAWNSNSSPGNSGLSGINLGTVFKFTSGSINSTWSGNSYGYMYKDLATSNGVAYTGSFWCYVSPNCNIDALPAAVEITGGYAAVNLPGSYNMNSKGTWQRVGLSTTGVGGNSRFLIYPQKYGVTDGSFSGYFLIAAPQVESGAYASPYTPSSRSNTQSIIDLTGNNILTANNLTYASDGIFSFNGSNSVITSPNNTIFDTQSPSVEVWVKTNALNQSGFWFEKGSVNTEYSLFQEGTSIVWRQGGSSQYTTTADYINTTSWAHIVGTYTPGSRKTYINGALVTSDTASSAVGVNSNGITIGSYNSGGYFYNGSIGTVRVYNRALSASEVKQNFSAARSRYGI